MDLLDARQAARDRERLRFQIAREWRAVKRWDFTESELSNEVEKRLEFLRGKRSAAKQLQLPLDIMSPAPLGPATKRYACLASKPRRVGLRSQIIELLEQAGEYGRTREELAAALGVKDGSVCAPVCHLIATGHACEPFKRSSRAGLPVAVVVLSRYFQGARS